LDKVNIAIIGCGGIAGAHRKGYEALWENGLREFQIVAACDVDEQKAADMAGAVAAFQGQCPEVYADVDAMLSSCSTIDAVDICALHRPHHILANACLEAGKHVTIEKPLAITLRAGKTMLDTAEKTGKLLYVAENYRRDIRNRAAKWAMDKGMIGAPRTFHFTDARERLWYWGWREHKQDAGAGWSLDGGVHFADLFRYYLGEVDELYAIVAAYNTTRYRDREAMADPVEVDVEDTTLALLKFENGVTGQWSSCSVAPGRETADRIIYGAEGSLEFGGGLQTRTQNLSSDELVEAYRKDVSHDEWERNFPRDIMDPIATELHDFIRWITTGEKAETDGLEGYKSEAIPIALFESHGLNAPVKLADVEALKHELYQNEINEGLGLIA